MSNSRQITPTRTATTATRRELQKAFRTVPLTREEELILRMRMGVPEPRSATLTFRGQDNPEMATRLAMMEDAALQRMCPRLVDEALEGDALKASIIGKLKGL